MKALAAGLCARAGCFHTETGPLQTHYSCFSRPSDSIKQYYITVIFAWARDCGKAVPARTRYGVGPRAAEHREVGGRSSEHRAATSAGRATDGTALRS